MRVSILVWTGTAADIGDSAELFSSKLEEPLISKQLVGHKHLN